MKLNTQEALIAYLFIFPTLFVIFVINFYPLFRTLYLSLFRKIVGAEEVFIGFKNYMTLFTSDTFWIVVLVTILFTGLSVALKMLLGLFVALVINKPSKLRGILRSIVLLPWAIPIYVSAYVWVWLYNPQLGLFNLLTEALGLGTFYWLQDYPMMGVVLSYVWRTYPFVALALLAGLQSIKQELYESASIDGATPLKTFRYVTLPHLKSLILILVTLQILWSFGEFVTIWILTAGGPGNATKTIPIYIFELAFTSQDLGLASALSIVALPIFLMLIIMVIRFIRE